MVLRQLGRNIGRSSNSQLRDANRILEEMSSEVSLGARGATMNLSGSSSPGGRYGVSSELDEGVARSRAAMESSRDELISSRLERGPYDNDPFSVNRTNAPYQDNVTFDNQQRRPDVEAEYNAREEARVDQQRRAREEQELRREQRREDYEIRMDQIERANIEEQRRMGLDDAQTRDPSSGPATSTETGADNQNFEEPIMTRGERRRQQREGTYQSTVDDIKSRSSRENPGSQEMPDGSESRSPDSDPAGRDKYVDYRERQFDRMMESMDTYAEAGQLDVEALNNFGRRVKINDRDSFREMVDAGDTEGLREAIRGQRAAYSSDVNMVDRAMVNKVPHIAGGALATAGLVNMMSNNRGQQSNAQLYGQEPYY